MDHPAPRPAFLAVRRGSIAPVSDRPAWLVLTVDARLTDSSRPMGIATRPSVSGLSFRASAAFAPTRHSRRSAGLVNGGAALIVAPASVYPAHRKRPPLPR